MSNFTDIEKALINGFLAVDASTPTSFPDMPITTIPDAMWLQVENIRGTSNPVTLGNAGEDGNWGVLQIDINTPVGGGSAAGLAKADALATAFKAGTILAFNGQEVRVASTSLSPGRKVDGFYRVSVSINYWARTGRSA